MEIDNHRRQPGDFRRYVAESRTQMGVDYTFNLEDVAEATIFVRNLNAIVFNREMSNQSDRGVAILGASFAEESLRQLLATSFPASDKTIRSLLDRPLGTFSAKIDVAFAIGVIGEHTHHDLECVRKIRNEFAHSVLNKASCNLDSWYVPLSQVSTLADNMKLSFASQAIRDRCQLFHLVRSECIRNTFEMEGVPTNSPRDAFVATIHLICAMIDHALDDLPQIKARCIAP